MLRYFTIGPLLQPKKNVRRETKTKKEKYKKQYSFRYARNLKDGGKRLFPARELPVLERGPDERTATSRGRVSSSENAVGSSSPLGISDRFLEKPLGRTTLKKLSRTLERFLRCTKFPVRYIGDAVKFLRTFCARCASAFDVIVRGRNNVCGILM